MSHFELICRNLRDKLKPVDQFPVDAIRLQRAAVALIMRNRLDEPEILIIKRAENPSDPWSGHLALPGGRAAAIDPSLRAVAVRETLEEVGIDLESQGHFLGQLDPLRPLTRRLPLITVTPMVATVSEDATARPNLVEVEDLFWVSLADLIQQGRADVVRLQVQGQWREWAAYPSPGGPIWGMTERILTQFLALLD